MDTPPGIDVPDELPPARRAELAALLAEVPLADRRPQPTTFSTYPGPPCWRCKKPGKLTMHHLPSGEVVQVHRSCHRKLHRKH